jgi:general secretion pathway protein G
MRGEVLMRLRRRGFTLIEVLVVIVVIAILATLVAPNIFRNVGDARSATARTQIETFGTALDAYRLDNGTYPTTAQGLAALWQRPSIDPPMNWKQPYLRKAIPKDPWGREYLYLSPGRVNPQSYDLQSLGADGKPGGEDENADIQSWK